MQDNTILYKCQKGNRGYIQAFKLTSGNNIFVSMVGTLLVGTLLVEHYTNIQHLGQELCRQSSLVMAHSPGLHVHTS